MKTVLLAALTGLAVATTSLVFAQSAGEPQDTDSTTTPPEEGDDPLLGTEVVYDSLPFHDLRRIKPVTGDAAAGQAIAEPCAACHGETGVATIPAMPHLAGQNATYLYEAIRLYHGGYVPDTPMSTLAEGLSDADMRNLAVFYASQPRWGLAAATPQADEDDGPAVAADDDADGDDGEDTVASMDVDGEALPPPTPDMLALGQQLYMHGNPARGIPGCQGCHGSDALGHPLRDQLDRSGNVPYALYPALRGQDRESLLFRMTYYRDQPLDKVSSHQVMVPIAKRLDQRGIDAIAAWLSSLEG